MGSGDNLEKIKESETWLNIAHITILDLTSATQDLSARLTRRNKQVNVVRASSKGFDVGKPAL